MRICQSGMVCMRDQDDIHLRNGKNLEDETGRIQKQVKVSKKQEWKKKTVNIDTQGMWVVWHRIEVRSGII